MNYVNDNILAYFSFLLDWDLECRYSSKFPSRNQTIDIISTLKTSLIIIPHKCRQLLHRSLL